MRLEDRRTTSWSSPEAAVQARASPAPQERLAGLSGVEGRLGFLLYIGAVERWREAGVGVGGILWEQCSRDPIFFATLG